MGDGSYEHLQVPTSYQTTSSYFWPKIGQNVLPKHNSVGATRLWAEAIPLPNQTVATITREILKV